MTKTLPEDGMIIFDHDLGANPDDIFALLLIAVKAPDRLLCGVSGNLHEEGRARALDRILELIGFLHVPSFCGLPGGVTDVFDGYLAEETAPPRGFSDFISCVEKCPEKKLSWLGIQGAVNLRAALDSESIRKRLYDLTHFGLSTKGLTSEWTIDGGTNWNVAPVQAMESYSKFKHTKVVGLQTTQRDELRVTPQSELGKRLQSSETPIAEILWQHCLSFYERKKVWPAMHDPVAASVILGESFVTFEKRSFEFSPEGHYRLSSSETAIPLQVSRVAIDSRRFMDYLTRAISEIL